ncbi:uncharacterized protein ZBAI_03832 [Zygosaccharomyces bailii ISA1307]|nr:uncharacterized protein ZBAI_03832 [Zygosaccharomyces bailii ISA1307]
MGVGETITYLAAYQPAEKELPTWLLPMCQTGYPPLAEAISFHFLGKTLADEPVTDNKPDLETGQEGIEQNTFYRFSGSLVTVLLTVPYSRSACLSGGAPFAAISSRTLVSLFPPVIKLDVIQASPN